MAVSQAMRRLLRLLELEEEQARLALESAVGEFRLLEQRLNSSIARSRNGRLLVAASAQNGNLTDRWAAIEETRTGSAHAAALKPRMSEAESLVAGRRQDYLAKRVERRQAETLIEEAEAREAEEAGRRSQQALDDWYLNRLHRLDFGLGGEEGGKAAGHCSQGQREYAKPDLRKNQRKLK